MTERHYFHPQTGEYLLSKNMNHLEAFSTVKALPNVELDERQYLAMLDNEGDVYQWPDNDPRCQWVIKTRFEAVTAYHKQTREPKEFADVSLVTDDYTLDKYGTDFDYWTESGWKTDEQAKFEYDYQVVNDTRYQLYIIMVDRLRNEAVSIESVEGDPEKAAEYRAQADAAYLKIKADNPFPKPPELTP